MIDYKEQYASQLKWAESQGYKNIYRRAISKGLRKYKNEAEASFRVKPEFETKPNGLLAIPDYPNYYANAQGEIWCDSKKRNRWIQISQQQLKSGYKQVQLYNPAIEKKTLYVHRLVWSAFNGSIPDGYEIHHINAINSDNYLMNLECIEKTIHRKMPKSRKNK